VVREGAVVPVAAAVEVAVVVASYREREVSWY
jgi:hypothetical protein